MIRRLMRDFLSLTRGERCGLQILGLFVLLLLLLRVFIPLFIHTLNPGYIQAPAELIVFQDSLRSLKAQVAGFDEKGVSILSGRNNTTYDLFLFDPNTVGLDSLVRLGIHQRTARILMNYRDAGGRFDADSDLLKIYGMKPDVFGLLQPYIRIEKIQTDIFVIDSVFELNSADSMKLVSVYSIGPVFARRIIRYREMLGGFYNRNQLMEVYGFSAQQYQELAGRSYIDTTVIRKMELNSMDADEFCRHPYLDLYQSTALITYREQMGDYRCRMQVIENGLLPDSVYEKIRPYLQVSR